MQADVKPVAPAKSTSPVTPEAPATVQQPAQASVPSMFDTAVHQQYSAAPVDTQTQAVVEPDELDIPDFLR